MLVCDECLYKRVGLYKIQTCIDYTSRRDSKDRVSNALFSAWITHGTRKRQYRCGWRTSWHQLDEFHHAFKSAYTYSSRPDLLLDPRPPFLAKHHMSHDINLGEGRRKSSPSSSDNYDCFILIIQSETVISFFST